MKFTLRILITFSIIMMFAVTTFAANNPTCVLMKFTDDTRYDLIESADTLSDLVMEKMLASGKFNLKETRPLDEDMETVLYDEKMRDLKGLETSFEKKDFNSLFESDSFKESRAQSIATAQVGQCINPEITSAIGAAHKADYLIQGTIINLGTGNWWNNDYEKVSENVNIASELAATTMPSSAFGDLIGGVDVKKMGIGVQCDVRVIKADTGEVIWNKRVIGLTEQSSFILGPVVIGSRKLSGNLYAKSMDKAAKKIVDAMIEDMDTNSLFVKDNISAGENF